MFCTIRAMKPPDRPNPLHDKAVYHRLRDGVIEQDALAKRLAALENVVKDDAKLSADIIRRGVVGLGGPSAESDDDALVERRTSLTISSVSCPKCVSCRCSALRPKGLPPFTAPPPPAGAAFWFICFRRENGKRKISWKC